MNSLLRRSDGFTLLELLIVIFLLVIISMATYQAVTNSFTLRASLSRQGDFYQEIRLSMNILKRDLSQVYSPIAIVPSKTNSSNSDTPAPNSKEAEEKLEMNRVFQGAESRPSDYWGPASGTSGIRPSRFYGTSTELRFVSASHIRMYKEKPESHFVKVHYGLEKNEDASRMIRTINTNVFDTDDRDDDKTLEVHPLLAGIKSFKFEYYWKEKDRWYNRWDTESSDFKQIYPDLIKATLEVEGENNQKFEGEYLFKLEIPFGEIYPFT